jgi:hypothetical protein
MNWSQDFTVKSNARRSARKAGVDVNKVAAFVKAGKTLYRFPMAAAPKAEPKTKPDRAGALRKVAGKPVDGFAAATGKPRRFKAPAKTKTLKAATAKTPKATDKNRRKTADDFTFEKRAPRAGGESGGKFQTVYEMLRKAGGASITAVCEATGWKPHTARARISVDVSQLVLPGDEIQRTRIDGVSVYAIVPSKHLDLPIGEAA